MQSLGASRIWGSGCFGKRALAVPPAVRLSALCRPVELDEAHQLWLARATPVVDVRSPREFRSEALQHAINVPLLQIPTTFPLSASAFRCERANLVSSIESRLTHPRSRLPVVTNRQAASAVRHGFRARVDKGTRWLAIRAFGVQRRPAVGAGGVAAC